MTLDDILNAPAPAPAEEMEEDPAIARWQDASALAGQLNSAAVQQLLSYLGDEHPMVRWQAGLALADTGERLHRRAHMGLPTWTRQTPELTYSGLLMLLRRGLQDRDPQRRAATADALALWEHEMVVAFLIQALEDSDPSVRASTAKALGHIRDKSASQVLIAALADSCAWVRRAAAEALGAIGETHAVAPLREALADLDPLVRASIVCALSHLHTARAREAIERCAADPDASVRWYAARALGQVGTSGSLPALQRLQGDGTTLFGQSLDAMASAAMRSIKRRERGLWSLLRRAFYAMRHALATAHIPTPLKAAARRYGMVLWRGITTLALWVWSKLILAARALRSRVAQWGWVVAAGQTLDQGKRSFLHWLRSRRDALRHRLERLR